MRTEWLTTVLTALAIDPGAGLQVVGAHGLPRTPLTGSQPVLVLGEGPDHGPAARAVIQGIYPRDHRVTLVVTRGGSGSSPQVRETDLADLASGLAGEGPWALYLPPLAAPRGEGRRFGELVQVMATLRGPGGCPWDREQDHTTLRPYLLEEAYEAVAAINSGDTAALQEELGDVLLQVVFHAQMAREAGTFDIDGVIQAITEKLIRRHPHVFGEVEVAGAADVVRNWEAIKAAERANKAATGTVQGDGAAAPSLLANVGKGMPALLRAFKVQRKAAKVGFDWPEVEGALAKVAEELAELREVYQSGERERYESELGDLLFAVVNVARFLKVDPEVALTATVQKFIRRFSHIEESARCMSKKLEEMELAEMDRLWEEAKRAEK